MLFKEQLLNFVGNNKTLQENNNVMKIDQNKKHALQGEFEINKINLELIHSKYNTNLTINIKTMLLRHLCFSFARNMQN